MFWQRALLIKTCCSESKLGFKATAILKQEDLWQQTCQIRLFYLLNYTIYFYINHVL